MSDWSAILQLLTRLPGIIIAMILIWAAFLFHLRRPGPATVAQIGGSILAFCAGGLSLVAQMMMQRGLQSGSSSVQSWATTLSAIFLAHQAGMLVYAIGLIASITGISRSSNE